MELIDSAQAAAILGARWQNDALRKWQPNDRQKMFLEAKQPEVALLGANRSGKSDALAALIASYARFGNPNPGTSYAMQGRLAITDRAVSIWVIGLSERLVREGIQPKLVTTAYTASETHPAFIPPSEIAGCNINDQTWKLKNGSILSFKTAEAGRDVFQSAGRDLVAFDEICDWEVYKEATFRAPGGNRRLMIRLAATLLPPLGMAGGISWYYPEKIKPWWAQGNKENRPTNNHPHMAIFTMGIRHNKNIAREEIERLEAMFPPGSLEAKIRLDGELLASIGGTLAYPAYNREIHYDANCTPESIDNRLPLRLCVDFNVTPCVWTIGQKWDHLWRFTDEISLDNCNIGQMVDVFRTRYPTHGAPLYIHGDQTGAMKSVQSGVSHYYLMQEALNGYPVPVQLMLPTRNPPVVDRLNAVNRQLSGPDGRIGLLFGPRMEEAMADCEEVLRDPRGGIKKVNDQSNPYFRRTHAMDTIGYAIAFADPVPRNASVERFVRSIPTPGYLGKGGRRAGAGMPSNSYYAGRLRMGKSGGMLPPRNPALKP
jgi:hypothetical protein